MTVKTRMAVATVIVLWASAFVGIKAGLSEYSPEGLALLRYLIASIVMGFIYLRLPTRHKISLRDKIGLLFVGVIGIGVYNLMLSYGEITMSSGVAGFIVSQTPILTTAFAMLFLGEKLTAMRLLGFLVSIGGVTLIAAGELGSFTWSTGLLYLLTATVAGSLYSIMQKPYMSKYNAIEATAYVIWGGALFLLLYVSHIQSDLMHASLKSTLTVIYLGVFPAALAYVMWAYVLSQIPVSQAVSFLYTMPFVAALLAWLLLGEVPALLSVIGALLAIVGVWLVSRSYNTKTPHLKTDAA